MRKWDKKLPQKHKLLSKTGPLKFKRITFVCPAECVRLSQDFWMHFWGNIAIARNCCLFLKQMNTVLNTYSLFALHNVQTILILLLGIFWIKYFIFLNKNVVLILNYAEHNNYIIIRTIYLVYQAIIKCVTRTFYHFILF